MNRHIKRLPISTDMQPEPQLSLMDHLRQWLTPDTRMKRWTYAGFILAAFSEIYGGPFGWLATPMLTVSVVYYTLKLMGVMRERALWTVRNRILISFVFVGVVPVILVFLIGLVAAWFWIGTLGSNITLRQFERTTNRLDHIPLEIQTELYRNNASSSADLEQAAQKIFQDHQDIPGLRIEIFEQKRDVVSLTYAFPPLPLHTSLPDWLENERFSGLVIDSLMAEDDLHLVFRAGSPVEMNNQTLYVLVSLPVGKDYQNLVWNASGVLISLDSEGEKMTIDTEASSDTLKLPMNMDSVRLPWGMGLKATQWHRGRSESFIIGMMLDPVRIFGNAISVDMSFIRILLIVVIFLIVGLACVELISFLLGMLISRRITTAVQSLTEGTQAIRAGNLDFRIKVQKRDQLGELHQLFNAMANSLNVLLQEVGEKERIEAELAMARDVQSRFIPKEPPATGKLELTGAWIPARMVSGDYYDFIEHENRLLDIVVGDISGKGMSAALMMAGLQAALRSQTVNGTAEGKPGRVSSLVRRLNQHLCYNTAPDKYATLFICSFDAQTGALTYCCAGHNPPLFIRNGSMSILDVGGCPIGLFPEWNYQEQTLYVEPGDLFVIYTDGITEAQNHEESEYGEERLKKVVMDYQRQPCEDIQDRILETVHEFAQGMEQFDDQTVVIGRVR